MELKQESDLRDIKTQTKIDVSKKQLVTFFEDYIMEKSGAKEELQTSISTTTCIQYKKGI